MSTPSPATKEALAAREADCKTAADFAALAREAAAVDADYAKSLLEKAEARCQLPADYLSLAETLTAQGTADAAGSSTRRPPATWTAWADLGQYIKLLEAVDAKIGDRVWATRELQELASSAAGAVAAAISRRLRQWAGHHHA